MEGKSLCRSWQECQNICRKTKTVFSMILGQLRLQFTSILCQWENVCYLLAFSSCFSPKLNSFFITNTESAFQIYLVVLEQGHSPQRAEKCTMGFSCCIVAEPWLCSIRCCTPTPSLFRAKLHCLHLWGSLSFPRQCLLFPHNKPDVLWRKSWGFFSLFPFQTSPVKEPVGVHAWWRQPELQRTACFPVCIPAVISVRDEIQALRMLLLSTCLQVPQEGDSGKSLSGAMVSCPASEQEWLGKNLSISLFPCQSKDSSAPQSWFWQANSSQD